MPDINPYSPTQFGDEDEELKRLYAMATFGKGAGMPDVPASSNSVASPEPIATPPVFSPAVPSTPAPTELPFQLPPKAAAPQITVPPTMTEKYAADLANLPGRLEDIRSRLYPSRGRNILGALISAGAGTVLGAGGGVIGREYAFGPYQREMARLQQGLGAEKTGAELEMGRAKAGAEIGREQAQTEQARATAKREGVVPVQPGESLYHTDTGQLQPVGGFRPGDLSPVTVTRADGTQQPGFLQHSTGNYLDVDRKPIPSEQIAGISTVAQAWQNPFMAGKIDPITSELASQFPDLTRKPRSQWTPEETALYGQAYNRLKNKYAEQLQISRGMAYGLGKFYNIINPDTGLPVITQGSNIPPGAMPGNLGDVIRIKQPQALINDIRQTATNVGESLQKLRSGFDVGTRAVLAAAISDPATTMGQFVQSVPRDVLTPDQIDYVVDVFQLRENAMALRTILRAGQGSEDLRRAILATIPGPGTPTPEFGARQILRFQQTIDRLEKSIPRVPGINAPAGGTALKVGDTRRFPNGRTGRWDGEGWVPQ